MWSTDAMLQPEHTTTALGHSSIDQQVMDQFTQMRSMLSTFLGHNQKRTACTAFCNYLALEMEGLEETDFRTLRNEAVKARQKEVVIGLSSHSNRHFYVAQVQLQHLCHRHFNSHNSQLQLQGDTSQPGTQMPSSQVIQPAQQSQVSSKGQQQQSRGQLTSIVVFVFDGPQTGRSRPLAFTWT